MNSDNANLPHYGFVKAAVRDRRTVENVVNEQIIRSWERCINDHILDPEYRPETVVVDHKDLKQRQERYSHLSAIAFSEMTNLYQQVAGSGHSILLTDSEGVVVNYVSDPMFTNIAGKTGLQLGAVWAEQTQGTNGMGTCLIEKRPLIIHKNEHFFSQNTHLSCSAAPILDPTGELIAVLDASSHSHQAQQHTMVLVNMSAQLIENRLLFCCMRDNYILRFHSRPEFITTLGEGVLAFDGDGCIKAANRSALFQLDMANIKGLLGQRIEALFDIHISNALSNAHDLATVPTALQDIIHGRRFYAGFQPPSSDKRRPNGRSKRFTTSTSGNEVKPVLDDLEFGDTRMCRNIERAKKLLERNIPFIILGETGTGKDVFVKAVHKSSRRADKPLIAVNCASLPETLIESELFGYRSGAFTGANKEGYRGKIVQANGGTLFLDEIGDMPLHLQARLLRVLEEREVIPLGGEVPIKVDIRLVSATHKDLQLLVDEGRFRLDLYYRLNGISLKMPPLRDREDRDALIKHLLEQEIGDRERIIIEDKALQALHDYYWPGNIRQLRNILRILIGLCDNTSIRVEDLPDEIVNVSYSGEPTQRFRPTNSLDIAERDAILRELEAAHWNITRVASKLHISRNTVYRKMKRFDIRPPR
ncbi:MAG: sigma-54-dependent Fis family transcriptional regulator [Candidatus Thiodiazotropha sp. (ex. Lucinisca nassula)]|uniref:sigma-54-dependent Fis family transcriptional regulator n=1 Tax=Candidatus Thiodiazotropha sp. LNASS1 TaxID=3096260 RepID=UPI000D3C60AA|nr:sigma-54-dependent Fis family transcriptional regulator [Candidatus Thiodiazotropha sp. (ex. Lucinisca nassula)]MBW9275235.1 sigma-54-dependent Fis family transcriptional regulator [Candidatus Thiodiazotropha sp. (ex. Lucinisca nassula)]PUB80503.1 MAG: sigma-54-dependent Fis family transcriptional regulator [gamma proteobacterium symbiont of Ctena orbiculata]